MSSTLLHSGKTEHFRALGETGQPVYQSALQLRKVISRRLPGMERHLAIPQRDQEGEGVDWYSSIDGDVIPWSSATEGEREDARIQLENFRKEVIALNQGPPRGQSGDHKVFTRLVKWVSHFPDNNFVYLVNGTPVITFWGFIHPAADRHANPLLCLYPKVAPEATEPAIPSPTTPLPGPAPAPEVRPAPVTTARSWWRNWWWLLLLPLVLGLLLFGLRACSSPGAPTLLPPPTDIAIPSISSSPRPLWQGWDFWSSNHSSISSLSTPDQASPGLGGGPALPSIDTPSAMDVPELTMSEPALSASPAQDADLTGKPPVMAGLGEMPASPALMEGLTASETLPENMAALSPDTPTMTPPTLEPLSLPADAPDGTARFLNGNWRGAGVMDSQSGRPLQVTYAFEQGKGVMNIRRGGSAGMTCQGPVSAAMRGGQLQVTGQERALCEDGSHYEMPRVQCHQANGETADCAASYDDESFPMQLRKAN